MGEGAAATVRKAKWGRTQVAVKLFRGEPDQIYKELTAEAAILHVRDPSPKLRAMFSSVVSHMSRDAMHMPAAPPLSLAFTPSCAASPPPARGRGN